MTMTWRLGKGATENELLRYVPHGKAHFGEVLEAIQVAGLADFEADVVLDLATGLGDAAAAAIEAGAVATGARVVGHDHATLVAERLRKRFGQNFEFVTTEQLCGLQPASSGSRILVLCSHLLGQCDSEESLIALESDLQTIASGVASFTKEATVVKFVGLEPGYRGSNLSARTSWRLLFGQVGLASTTQNFRVSNLSREAGIPKSALMLELASEENLAAIDPRILRSAACKLDFGFGEVFHEAIDAKIFSISDGVSFGDTKHFVSANEYEKILTQLRQRMDNFNSRNEMNHAILGMVP